jgi:hypothetical protein
MVAPQMGNKERFERAHALTGRQIEKIKKIADSSFYNIEQVLMAAISAGHATLLDLDDFKYRQKEVLASLDFICLIHATGVCSNLFVEKRINMLVKGFNDFHREFKCRYTDLL